MKDLDPRKIYSKRDYPCHMYWPLKATPALATTHVWMTVFSCLVNGCFRYPDFSTKLVHVFTKKNPSSPADTFSDGTIPVVRFNFITMNVNNMLNTKLTTNALALSCFCHPTTSLLSNIFSTDSSSSTPPSAARILSSPSVCLVLLDDRSMPLPLIFFKFLWVIIYGLRLCVHLLFNYHHSVLNTVLVYGVSK